MNFAHVLPIVAIGVGVFVVVFFAAITDARPRLLASRLAAFDKRPSQDTPESLDDERLSRPIGERLVGPTLDRIGRGLNRVTGDGIRRSVDKKLTAAGGLIGLTPAAFVALQFVLAAVFGALGLLLGLLLSLPGLLFWVLVGAGPLLGFVFPQAKLSSKIRARHQELRDAMPNTFDLLTISVEAGLAFEAAMLRVAEKYDNALGDEFNQILSEVKLGRPRRDALRAMADRAGVDELTKFVNAVIQSEQMGTSLSQTLRIQSEEMRRRRRQRAEEAGAKAPLKMLFPMVGCIFPTIFVVLLGPAALTLFAK